MNGHLKRADIQPGKLIVDVGMGLNGLVIDVVEADTEGGKVFGFLQEGKLQRYQWDRDGLRQLPPSK